MYSRPDQESFGLHMEPHEIVHLWVPAQMKTFAARVYMAVEGLLDGSVDEHNCC